MHYSKLYILTELSANDVEFIPVDRQKLDLSKYIYLWYRKFYICRDRARFYEHKNDPRSFFWTKTLSEGMRILDHASGLDQKYPCQMTWGLHEQISKTLPEGLGSLEHGNDRKPTVFIYIR